MGMMCNASNYLMNVLVMMMIVMIKNNYEIFICFFTEIGDDKEKGEDGNNNCGISVLGNTEK